MPNVLSDIVPILVAQGLQTLRSACVMPRLVNTDYSNDPADQGDTVNVWIPSAQVVSDVAPTAAPLQAADSQPVKAPIPLNKWRRSGFYLTDKQQEEIVNGFTSRQTIETVARIAEDINAYIFSKYKKVYGFTGTPGTTPFATANSIADAANARAVLNRQQAPGDQRRLVLDVNAEANALNQPVLTTFLNTGSDQTIIQGTMGRKLGFDWAMDQQVPTHTNTPLTAGAATANGVNAIGAGTLDGGRTGTVSIAKATNTSQLVAGDILNIAGDPQNYVVLADILLAVGNTTVSISPSLRKATAGGEAITVKATHVVNLGFHRDAFAFVSRPLMRTAANSMEMLSVPDPVSGVTIRLEVSRQNKQMLFDFDVLYGAECVRPELACRLAG